MQMNVPRFQFLLLFGSMSLTKALLVAVFNMVEVGRVAFINNLWTDFSASNSATGLCLAKTGLLDEQGGTKRSLMVAAMKTIPETQHNVSIYKLARLASKYYKL